MSLTEVHHKSLAGINKLPADLWWACLKFITNHWLGLKSCQLICDEPQSDMYARMCQHVGESMQYVYASSTWQGGAPIPFSSILLQLPMTTSYSLGASHRILERRDFPTHRDSAGRVHLRPPPPKWADGHWLQWEGHPTSHSYWMRLPKVSLLAWQVYLEGLTLASAVYKKKGWHWDARWNSQPVALCDEGAFQHLCFSALSHSLSAGKSFSTRSLMLFSIVLFNTVRPEDLEVLEDGQCLKGSWQDRY